MKETTQGTYCRVIVLSCCRGRAYDNAIVRQCAFIVLSCYRIVADNTTVHVCCIVALLGAITRLYDRVGAMSSLSQNRKFLKFSLTRVNIGLGISKRNFSYSFHPISANFMPNVLVMEEHWQLHFLAICQILNKRPRGLDALLELLPDETNIALWIMAM